MSLLGRSVVFGLAFAAALVAIVFGMRRLREAPAPGGRGAWAAVRRAFWSAAAVLLGSSAAGCSTSCYSPGPGDVVQWDSEAAEDGDDAVTLDDDAADPEGGETDVPADVLAPEAMCYDPVEFDAGTEASEPDGGKQASAAEARRALARAEAVAALLRDSQTHPAVRETLRRDLGRLVLAARKARRTLGGVG